MVYEGKYFRHEPQETEFTPTIPSWMKKTAVYVSIAAVWGVGMTNTLSFMGVRNVSANNPNFSRSTIEERISKERENSSTLKEIAMMTARPGIELGYLIYEKD